MRGSKQKPLEQRGSIDRDDEGRSSGPSYRGLKAHGTEGSPT